MKLNEEKKEFFPLNTIKYNDNLKILENRGFLKSFYFEINDIPYSRLHISVFGGNCKMCKVSDITDVILDDTADAVKALDNVFKVLDKLVFVVNVGKLEVIDKLSEHYQLVRLSVIPIGYSRIGDTIDSELFYVGTFLTNHNFRSTVTSEVVLDRLKDQKIQERIQKIEKNYNKF